MSQREKKSLAVVNTSIHIWLVIYAGHEEFDQHLTALSSTYFL